MYSGGGNIATGYLEVCVTGMDNRPIDGATVRIYKETDEGVFFETLSTTKTNGKTTKIMLTAPLIRYSYEESQRICPYEKYNVEIHKEGYDFESRMGVQIFAICTSILSITMVSCLSHTPQHHVDYIDDHKLYHNQDNHYA